MRLRSKLLSLLAGGSVLCAATPIAPAAPRPNVVLIYSDELPPEYLGCYGGKYPTPNLDRMAAEGLRFERAHVPSPGCTPSRWAVLTGRFPGRCEHPVFLREQPADGPCDIQWNTHLGPQVQTLPRLLSANGYVTGAAGKWHLSILDDQRAAAGLPKVPRDKPFADPAVQEALRRYQDAVRELVRVDGGFDSAASMLFGNWESAPHPEVQFHNIPWITRGALEFIDRHAGGEKPFFLYVTPTAVHGPPHQVALQRDCRKTPEGTVEEVAALAFPRPELAKRMEGLPSWEQHKLTGMTELDHHVGLILKKLDDLGIAENTLVFYMADHGIEPGKGSVYDRGTHVPFLVRWPAGIRRPGVRGGLAQNVDIAATVLAVAGVKVPAEKPLDGVDLRPTFDDLAAAPRPWVYAEMGYARAISDGHFKYIAFRLRPKDAAVVEKEEMEVLTQSGPRRKGHALIAATCYPRYFDADQLYDLAADPLELKNLAGDPAHAATLAKLRAALEKHLATFRNPFLLDPVPVMATEKYRAIGERTRRSDLSDIRWIKTDHGEIVWPPKAPIFVPTVRLP